MASPLNFGQIRALHDRRDIDAAHLFNHQAIKFATFAPLGGCREPEVSEFAPQVAQELCGVGRLLRLDQRGRQDRARRWHEPRQALSACVAYCRRIKAASCQISRAKKSTGRSFSIPAAAIASQMLATSVWMPKPAIRLRHQEFSPLSAVRPRRPEGVDVLSGVM